MKATTDLWNRHVQAHIDAFEGGRHTMPEDTPVLSQAQITAIFRKGGVVVRSTKGMTSSERNSLYEGFESLRS